jgi:YVTN family beta-propeller protein
MSFRGALALATLAAALSACGGTSAHEPASAQTTHRTYVSVRKPAPPGPQALVTDETQNQLLVADLPSGHIAQRVSLPVDPEDIAATGDGGIVVVVSARAGKVTLLDRQTLRPTKTLGGFDQPHIVAISPDGEYAYVTDDARGTLTVIRLRDMRVTSRVAVGLGAHHLAFSPDERRVWVGLGERAQTITILSTVRPSASSRVDPGHPRVVGRFAPGFPAHDLSFSPDGSRIWVTSATSPDLTVFDARTRRVAFHVPVGPPPQHLAFQGRYAFITSGYGGTVEKVNAANGRIITRASAPYGSFELAARDGYVATASLLRGTLTVYSRRLGLLRVSRLAPATREVAISRP